jgi:hypothetical protein
MTRGIPLCGVAVHARGSARVGGGGTPCVRASLNRRSVRNPANALVGGSSLLAADCSFAGGWGGNSVVG